MAMTQEQLDAIDWLAADEAEAHGAGGARAKMICAERVRSETT